MGKELGVNDIEASAMLQIEAEQVRTEADAALVAVRRARLAAIRMPSVGC